MTNVNSRETDDRQQRLVMTNVNSRERQTTETG